MALILDTNALSAFIGGDTRLLAAIHYESNIGLPAIVLGEYLFGIISSRFRAKYEHWFRDNLPLFRVLAVTRDTAAEYALIRRELKARGLPIPANDLWIAALAREHGFPLVSRDRHFQIIERLDFMTW